tara:strand:+ start:33 stop:200 length:168 start_codon:yes stop_codon:yes gene_type:complete
VWAWGAIFSTFVQKVLTTAFFFHILPEIANDNRYHYQDNLHPIVTQTFKNKPTTQ